MTIQEIMNLSEEDVRSILNHKKIERLKHEMDLKSAQYALITCKEEIQRLTQALTEIKINKLNNL